VLRVEFACSAKLVIRIEMKNIIRIEMKFDEEKTFSLGSRIFTDFHGLLTTTRVFTDFHRLFICVPVNCVFCNFI
jgi:hypothetical protein